MSSALLRCTCSSASCGASPCESTRMFWICGRAGTRGKGRLVVPPLHWNEAWRTPRRKSGRALRCAPACPGSWPRRTRAAWRVDVSVVKGFHTAGGITGTRPSRHGSGTLNVVEGADSSLCARPWPSASLFSPSQPAQSAGSGRIAAGRDCPFTSVTYIKHMYFVLSEGC